jgi:hypothetical protein
MSRRIWVIGIVVGGALALPASSLAQATRTWVSGVGDDANPCSRTAPCKTWAGAISKTAAGGEIDALDPGGFGAVTITKSITLDGGGGQVASILVAGTPGITVAAANGDQVTIRNLRLDGLGTTAFPGTTGINFISGGTLRVENTQIFGFSQSGIADTSNSPTTNMVISGTTIDDGAGDGVMVAPPSNTAAQALLENDSLENNRCGLAVGAFGPNGGTPDFTNHCGLADSGVPAVQVNVSVDPSSMSENTDTGVMADGSPAIIYMTGATVFGNGTGLAPINGGRIVSVGANNSVFGNGSDGAPTATVSTGAQGPQGVQGPQGQTGQPGQVVLLVCTTKKKRVKVHHKHKVKFKTKTIKKCTAKPVTGTVTFTVTGHVSRATLSRAGRTYAAGQVGVAGNRTTGYLRVRARMRPARYVLTLLRGRRVVSRRAVVVG